MKFKEIFYFFTWAWHDKPWSYDVLLSQLMRKSDMVAAAKLDSDGSRTSAVVEGDDDVEDIVMSLTIDGES